MAGLQAPRALPALACVLLALLPGPAVADGIGQIGEWRWQQLRPQRRQVVMKPHCGLPPAATDSTFGGLPIKGCRPLQAQHACCSAYISS